MHENPAKNIGNYLNNISDSQKLRLFFLGIIAGLFLSQYIFYPKYILLLGFIFLVTSFFFRRIIFIILSLFLLSNFYGQWRNNFDFDKDPLPNLIAKEVIIKGKVINFPDIRQKSTRVIIQSQKILTDNSVEKNNGKLLLILKNGETVDYGNFVEINGKIKKPISFSANFNYLKYLQRFGVQTIVQNPAKFEVIAEKTGNTFIHLAKNTRNLLEKNLVKSLPTPHNQIAMGILLGVKNELPESTQSNFKKSGLQHLLVVSGANISILIIAMSFLLGKIGRKISFIFSFLAILFFVLMTGADPPVIRAAIMGGIVGLGSAWGQMNNVKNIFLLSAVIIGLFNPFIIHSDLGFTLSFGATAGIIVFYPWFEKKIIDKIKNKFFRGTFSILAISLSAQIAIFPFLIDRFGSFPMGGIPANLAAEPLIPFIMFFSFLSSLLGFLPIIITKIIAIPAFILLESLLEISHFFAKIPALSISNKLNYFLGIIILGVLVYGLFSGNSVINKPSRNKN